MPIIEINGKKVEADSGAMIIEVADTIGVQIPRFCYHKKLSIAANCRMCLVDVEKAPKPLPACATPITDGMKIWTQSPKAILAQKSVMEFLLINHPLDCPICDQGGECELQDLSMGFGADTSRFTEGKRVVLDQDIGPLIATDMTRCIQCTRCVRFGTEVAGVRELGATGRGEHLEIRTFIERTVDSEVSGNVIDICPVGALTSKPYRFTARGWELTQKPSIAPHDAFGSNLFFHIRRNQIMRVVPRENESINEIWLSDRDRFSYEGLTSPDRLLHPKMKKNGRWHTVSWGEALEKTVERLQDMQKIFGQDSIGLLVSPNATLEEQYLLQKLMRCMGTNNIDHRLRQTDFRNQEAAPLLPNLGIGIAEIEQQSALLLVGSDIRKEQPLLAIKCRKMVLAGGQAYVINPVDFAINFEVAQKAIVAGGDLVSGLAKVTKAVLNQTKTTLPEDVLHWLAEITPETVDIEMAKGLIAGEKSLILLGAQAVGHPSFSQLFTLANLIAQLTRAKIGILSDGVNGAGAWLTGCVPHRLPGGKSATQGVGTNVLDLLEQGLKGYVLFNTEPELDCLEGLKALTALQKAKQVIAITPFESKALLDYADILLPLTPFSEMSGTWINMEGQWQTFEPVVPALGESRPGWKICRVLGNLCKIPGFEYDSIEQVRTALSDEILNNTVLKEWQWSGSKPLEYLKTSTIPTEITRISSVPLCAGDGLVRRAKSLQKTKDAGDAVIRMNQSLATRLALKGHQARVIHQGIKVILSFEIDNTVPDNSVLIASGIPETVSVGGPYASLILEGVTG